MSAIGTLKREVAGLRRMIGALRPASNPDMLTSRTTRGVTRKPKNTGGGGLARPPKWG